MKSYEDSIQYKSAELSETDLESVAGGSAVPAPPPPPTGFGGAPVINPGAIGTPAPSPTSGSGGQPPTSAPVTVPIP